MKKLRVLFVCLGNICRSPTAEGVFKKMVADEGLEEQIFVDSAGTSGWHIGSSPDHRTCMVAESRGIDLSGLRGRQVAKSDFDKFDYILAMDSDNLHNLRQMQTPKPDQHLGLFLEFSRNYSIKDVPDPYHGGTSGFEKVYDLIEDASEGLLNQLKIALSDA